jgi:hypothetical protein
MLVRTLVIILILFSCTAEVKSQSPIVAITSGYMSSSTGILPYSATPAPNSGTFTGCPNTLYNYSYSNGTSNALRLTGITTNGKNYSLANRPAVLKLRRVNNANVTGQRSIVFLESTVAPAACPFSGRFDFKSAYQDVMETFLNNSILNQGTDNIFTNSSNSDGNNNNIERVDLIYPAGVASSSATDAGFALFDRGNINAHDPFRIAAITSLDANGNPASYGAVKTCVGGNGVNNGSYGHPTIANGNHDLLVYVLRKEATDPRLKASAAIDQQLGGVFFSFADLGIAPGQTIYGYSLIGPDGIANPTSTQLLNINDPSVYPTNTTEAQGGGLDLIAVNALFISGPVLAATSSTLNATVNQHTVNLNWMINGIDSSSMIYLERSENGIQFETINSQLSNGISAEGLFNDDRNDGNYYYRLRITVENKIYYSEILKVRVGNLNNINIYPNVVAKGSTIMVEGLKNRLYNAAIVSSEGKVYTVSNLNGCSSAKLSLPYNLTSGIYFIYFTDSENNRSNVSRLLIQ